MKKKKRRIMWICALAAAAVLIVVMLSVIPAQRAMRRELDAEKQRLTEQLNNLLLQYEGKEEMLEYMYSTEFLLRYARENLGYMLEGDIRVDVDDPNAVTIISNSLPAADDALDSPDSDVTP